MSDDSLNANKSTGPSAMKRGLIAVAAAAREPELQSKLEPVAAQQCTMNDGIKPALTAAGKAPTLMTSPIAQTQGEKSMSTENQNFVASFPFLSAFPAAQKSMKFMSEFSAIAQGNVDAFTRSARIATEGATTIGQDAVALTKANAEKLSSGVRQLAALRSPTDLMQAQITQTQALIQESCANFSKFGQTLATLAEQVAAPLTERYAIASGQVKAAAAI